MQELGLEWWSKHDLPSRVSKGLGMEYVAEIHHVQAYLHYYTLLYRLTRLPLHKAAIKHYNAL